MAKVKITGHASGSGVLTITAPNTSTDRTITLPDATATIATTAATDALTTRVNGASGRKNWIINGDFQLSQRGAYTSATSLTSTSVYHLDRFKTKINTISGTLTHKLNQVVNGKTTNTMLLTATSSATGRVETVQQIEATAPFVSQTITFSAWVKSDNTSARLIVHQDGANVQTSSNTHTGGGAFELLKGTVTCASNSGNMYLYSGIQAAGTGNVSVANNDYFEMAFVQLEYGSVATDFEHRSFGEELTLCQRYYTQSTSPLIPYASGTFSFYSFLSLHGSSNAYLPRILFPTTMRANPTCVVGTMQSYNGSSWSNWTNTSSASKYPDGFTLGAAGGFSGTFGLAYLAQTDWTADAEL